MSSARPKVKPRPLVSGDLERLGIPEAFWRVRVDGLPEPAVGALRAYVARVDALAPQGVGVAFQGPPGVGKTALASILLRELRPRGYSGLFLSAWDLREFSRTRAPFDSEQSYVERARAVDFLVLDNVTEADGSDPIFGKRQIEEMLTARAAAGRPSIVTTRLTDKELDAGPWRGLLTAGRLVGIPVAGPDLRAGTLRAAREMIVGKVKP